MKKKNLLAGLIATVGSLILVNMLFKPAIENNTNSDNQKINSITIDSPDSSHARAPKFSGLDSAFLDNIFNQLEVDIYKARIEAFNPNQENIWRRKKWNINYFKNQNLPIIVGKIKDTRLFSYFYQGRGLRFLDLPIYMAGQGWRIPIELEQFKEVIKMAVDHERLCNPDFEKDNYVYITVDQGCVEPQTAQRRAGWHSDSYRKINDQQSNILVDHVYVIYNNCPTRYVEGPFSLDDVDATNIDDVLEALDKQAINKEIKAYSPFTLLRMDPYCIHDAGVNNLDKPIDRTFVKVSFSKTKYRHLGNAHNNLFIYDWPMVPRKKVPYTKEAIAQSSHRKDRDLFLEIDPSEIDFCNKTCNVSWASNQVEIVSKIGTVYAEPAKEGEIIETKSKDSLVTISVADKGDYKISFSPNDIWLLSGSKFHEIYEPVSNEPNTYKIKKNIRYAVQLTKKVRMKAPWGTLAYAVPGDYLVYRNKDDIYFVSKHIFEKSYK